MFESKFNLHPHNANGRGCSHDVPLEASNTMTFHQPEDLADTENMLVEYA